MGRDGIYTIDANYGRAQMAAVYAIIHEGAVALIETAHAHSLTAVEAFLAQQGLSNAAVKYIMLTHIHLDHAGGAGSYMAAFPHAQLVVHPKGVRHMQDPTKLQQGVTSVYGAEFVAHMYGELKPIAAHRIISATDGMTINLHGRLLTCYDTPGHANHHNIILDVASNSIFSGDVFGVGYPELNVTQQVFGFPSTTPVNFDPEQMLHSINKIVELAPSTVYLTHFGAAQDIPRLAQDLRRMVSAYVAIAKANVNSSNCQHNIYNELLNYVIQEAQQFGCKLPREEIAQVIQLDMQINAQGLEVWLTRQIRS
jgi:hydroxyacylglutathione hydrolase